MMNLEDKRGYLEAAADRITEMEELPKTKPQRKNNTPIKNDKC